MKKMTRTLSFLTVMAASWALAGAARADLKVVTTTSDLAAVAKEVGGEHVSVKPLALPTQDPHFVDARPHLALDLARADMLIVVGLALEVGWLPTLQTGSRNGAIQNGGRGYLDCSTLVRKLEVPAGPVDRSMGDVHPGGNPHYMLDPRQAAAVARGMARRMGELDPAHRAAYEQNAGAFVTRLEQARRRWERELASLRGAKVIAYHRALPYLADWLGFEVVTHIEPRPGVPPNPRHVATVLTAARREGVRLILQQSYYASETSELIASRSGARVVRIPGGPDVRRGESYVDFIDGIVRGLRR